MSSDQRIIGRVHTGLPRIGATQRPSQSQVAFRRCQSDGRGNHVLLTVQRPPDCDANRPRATVAACGLPATPVYAGANHPLPRDRLCRMETGKMPSWRVSNRAGLRCARRFRIAISGCTGVPSMPDSSHDHSDDVVRPNEPCRSSHEGKRQFGQKLIADSKGTYALHGTREEKAAGGGLRWLRRSSFDAACDFSCCMKSRAGIDYT